MLTVPPVVDQVTAVLLVPVMVAVNCCVLPVSSEAEPGEMDTATTEGSVTVTVAEAELLLFASLVTVTVYVPAAVGAMYRPLDETVPPVADQVTPSFLEPLTVAVNCCVPPVGTVADTGEIDTARPPRNLGLWAAALKPNKASRPVNAIVGKYESNFLGMCNLI